MTKSKQVAGGVETTRAGAGSWADDEVAESAFRDERLGKRFRTLLGQLADGVGQSIPFACQDWGQYQGGLPLLLEPSGQRSSDLVRALAFDARLLRPRASDPPPGNVVVWRGLSRLTDITLGVRLGAKVVGN